MFDFCKRIGINIQKVKNIRIMGGGRIAYYLAKYLDEAEIKSRIIEINRKGCIELIELLPNALIICGDGSDDTLLHSENLSDMGAFISVTGRDEDNLISALLAKQCGVQKVVAKINRINNFGAINKQIVRFPKILRSFHGLRMTHSRF